MMDGRVSMFYLVTDLLALAVNALTRGASQGLAPDAHRRLAATLNACLGDAASVLS
jgi:hypothetical protein